MNEIVNTEKLISETADLKQEGVREVPTMPANIKGQHVTRRAT